MWREAAEIWIGTAARWWGLTSPHRPGGSAEADRRFDAAEWEQHPFFRLLSRAISHFPNSSSRKPSGRRSIRRTAAACLPSPAVPRRDKPTTFLPTNSAALRKAWETGGGSVADGLATFGRSSPGAAQHDRHAAFAPGKNLATTQARLSTATASLSSSITRR